MRDLVSLVEYIAKTLVSHPEAVEVVEIPKRHLTVIELRVAPDDMGRVIGKEGRVANAIRTLIRTATADSGMRYVLDIT
ncbi:MAG TPA: KH domain-containing protein [Aggregatilineales bacterium]|nr:KH domain-containing protein [Anaerolineales bacterium]HRE47268.1 KH domain-containing protein [Aggregatilineales bacterium]